MYINDDMYVEAVGAVLPTESKQRRGQPIANTCTCCINIAFRRLMRAISTRKNTSCKSFNFPLPI